MQVLCRGRVRNPMGIWITQGTAFLVSATLTHQLLSVYDHGDHLPMLSSIHPYASTAS